MPDDINPGFAARTTALLRAAVAEFGGYSEASRQLDIPRTTIRDIVQGRTQTPSDLTIERLSEGYQALQQPEQWKLQAGADFFSPLPTSAALNEIDIAWLEPEGYRSLVGTVQHDWIAEQKRRESQGLPPLFPNSP